MNDFLASLMAFAVSVFPSLGEDAVPGFNGYVEADYVYVAASAPGRIESVGVTEGETVAQGQILLTLESTSQAAALRSAQASAAVAQANLDNLQTGGRAAEIEVARASLHRAEADQSLARSTLARSEQLFERGLVPPAQVDADRARLASADAQVEQLRAQLEVSLLPARDAQRIAAEASLEVARAQVALAQAALDDRVVASPISGQVERVFFVAGEVTAAGTPVISIFQPDNLKAIFFIPEPARAEFVIGDRLDLTCDGCARPLGARITRLASQPQYTPPILYSRDERERLVFKAEAVIEGASGLLPGQPVTLWRPQ